MKLSEQFKKETGTEPYDQFNGGILEYVEWLEQRAETASAVDTIVSNTVGIQLNNEFNGGKIVIQGDAWDILQKYKGQTISVKSDELDIHLSIHK